MVMKDQQNIIKTTIVMQVTQISPIGSFASLVNFNLRQAVFLVIILKVTLMQL